MTQEQEIPPLSTVNENTNGPRRLRFKRVKDLKTGGRKHVPLPSGPYKVVGCRDIMTGTKGPESGILVRLFYPAADQSRDIREQHYFWPNWLPHEKYRKGYADVGEVKSPLFLKMVNWLVGSAFIPCVVNARPLRDGSRLPVVLLSHGIGGCRTTHSAICLELASHGFLVVAVEHRDGTACTTFYADEVKIPLYRSNPDLSLPTVEGLMGPAASAVETHPKGFISTIREEESPEGDEDSIPLTNGGLHSRRESSCRPSNIIPNTKTLWIDYRVVPERADDYYEKRNSQIQTRVQELIQARNLIDKLNSGQDVQNILDGLLDPREFYDLLNMESIILMGHSMGAASCLATIDADDRFQAVVCLDVWMYPIHREKINLRQRPVIFVNSEKFQSRGNMRKIKELLDGQEDHETCNHLRKVYTIRGSVHYNQTDIPFVFSYLMKLIFGGSSKRSPFSAHDLMMSLVLTFLRDSSHKLPLPERENFLRKNKKKVKEGFPKQLSL